MATSGSTDYNLNARQIIHFALSKLGLVSGAETFGAEETRVGKDNLNVMLKAWQSDMPNLWRVARATQALTSGTASYSLTAYQIVSARYRDANGRDLPMEVLTADEYDELPLKSTSGIPTSYYYDRQRDGGTLYVWPVLATATTQSIAYTYQRRFQDIDSLENDLDIPTERLALVGYWLAMFMAPDFNVQPTSQRLSSIERMASLLMSQAKASDREPVVRFEPERRR